MIRIRKRWMALIAAVAVVAIVGVAVVVFGVAFYYLTSAPKLTISQNASEPEKLEKIDQWVESLHQQQRFNGAILIARDGQPLLMKTYGFTDHTANEKLTEQSSFRLASLSKQFTAAGILVLVEQQKIELDQPVGNYLEGFAYPQVTVRHLLNAVSGIPDVYPELAEEHREEAGDILSIAKVIELINKYPAQVNFPPNDHYEYNNTNYVILAGIIEAVSDLSFEQFMAKELFEPLGMNNTRVWNLLSADATFSNKTTSFYQCMSDDREDQQPTWIDGIAGDGGVFCSIEDFLIWNEFWSENELISADLLAQAFVRPELNDGIHSEYGFGWLVKKEGAWHNGSWLGARTYYSRNSSDNTCIVLLDNSSCLMLDSMGSKIEAAFKE